MLNISQQFIAQGDYDGLDAYLAQFGDHVLPLKYSIDVQKKDYTAASEKLDLLAATGGYDDYVLPQQLYLNWIEDKENLLSQDYYKELVALEKADTPTSTYARSMLGIMYGKQFEPKVPMINGVEVTNHVAAIEKEDLVSPNPFVTEVKVLTAKYQGGRMAVYNVLGVSFYSSNVTDEKNVSIHTTSWKPGVYFLYMTDATGHTHIEKNVKQ